jgi:DGQHR domain-containing protein
VVPTVKKPLDKWYLIVYDLVYEPPDPCSKVLRRGQPRVFRRTDCEEWTVIGRGPAAPKGEHRTVEPSSAEYETTVARYRRVTALRAKGVTLQDIANQEGISRERVRQILEGGIPKPTGRPPTGGQPGKPNRRTTKMAMATIEAAAEPREAKISVNPATMKVQSVLVPGRMAIAAMTPDEMDRLFFVSSFSVPDPMSPAPRKHGYQRDPMDPRLPGIARYFLEGDNQYLITPIVVSVRLEDEDDIEEFIELFNAGNIEAIHERWHRGVVSVVDGQHRYLGLVRAHTEHLEFNPVVPVMLYFGLDYSQEATLFDIINSTQRKLPKALIEVTKGDITEADARTHDQAIRNITFALARDKDSVWFEDVNMTGARQPDKPVTYEGLRRSTANMFSPEVLSRVIDKGLNPETVAKQYWKLVAGACPEAWTERPEEEVDPGTGEIVEVPVAYRLKELVGVAAVSKLGKDILTSSLEAPRFSERLSDLVSLLSEVNWAKKEGNPWMASQAGFAGQKDLYTMLYALVYLGKKPGEDATA